MGVRYNINRGHGTIETLDGEPNPVGSVAGLHSIADSKKIAYVPAGRAVANYRASPVQYMLWMHLSTSSKRMPDFVRLWDKMVSLGAISDPSMAVVYAAGACNMPLLLQ